ncbi:hypothetical protein Pfo_027711 [Paulownia fortunei]|nr:hypothetical protein Pfo_027711 [Paulownia fortunei]
MGAKTSLIIFFLCFFMHACNARPFAPTTWISDKKSQPHKIEEKLKVSMNISPNVRGTFGHRMPVRSAVSLNPKEKEDLCKKNKGIKGTKSGEIVKVVSLLFTRPRCTQQYHRWRHLNVREMDLHSSIFREEDLSETDYQPPHRKSPIHNK